MQQEFAKQAADAVRQDVAGVIADVFHYPGTVTLATTRKDIPRWDSLQHVALIIALEQRFGISLSMDELAEITSVRTLQTVLKRHGV